MILIRMKETRPIDIGRDPWRIIMRRAHQAMGEHWHANILPDHFTPQAKYRYRHKLRSKKYRNEKRRAAQQGRPFRKGQQPVIMGGEVDNVLTGYMKQQLEQSKTIRAFPSRVTVRMFGPRYITMNNKDSSNQPDKRREITETTIEQKKELAKVLKDSVVDQLNAYRASRTRTI